MPERAPVVRARACYSFVLLPSVLLDAVTSAIHDRMPVILDRDNYDLWLDPGMRDASVVSEVLKPYDARAMRCFPVSVRVNSVVNDDEGCAAAVELAQIQDRLFS